MSTAVRNISATRTSQPAAPATPQGYETNGRSEEDAEYVWWREKTRVVLNPTASPSAMGLFGFSAATLIVAGDPRRMVRVDGDVVLQGPRHHRDGGPHHVGLLLDRLRHPVADGGGEVIPAPPGAGATHAVGYGMWFVMLSALTLVCALAALGKNIALFTTLGLLTAGSTLVAAGEIAGAHTTIVAGGWVLVASVGAAIYTGAARMFTDTYGRTILPVLEWNKRSNIPGKVITRPLEYANGMPGARIGQ
jgi:succinate-acetate transporter protein